MFLALIGVLALLFACLWVLKKLTAQRGAAAGLLGLPAALCAAAALARQNIAEAGTQSKAPVSMCARSATMPLFME